MKYWSTLVTLSLISLISLLTLSGCNNSAKDDSAIKVGTISGPETELMYVAKEVAKNKYGLKVNIVEFSDYSLPNAALNEGSLDANAFQHQAFLDNEIKTKKYNLVVIGKTFIYPMAVYSNKIKNLADMPQNGTVAIPNDSSNETRALILLSKANLIKLKSDNGVTITPLDIISNPKNLKFKELDSAQLGRVLPDVTISVINTNFAISSNLYPNKDAIYREDKNSPYANLIVARADNANDPRLQQLVKAFQSQEVLKKADELFKNQSVAAW